MIAGLKRSLDAGWLAAVGTVEVTFGHRAGVRFARTALRALPSRVAARLTWPTLNRLPYREADRDLWEFPRACFGGPPVRILPTDLGGRYFALCGFWEPHVTRFVAGRRAPGLLIDVGANFGYFSALWLRCPGASVVAVEPSPVYLPVLRANLDRYPGRARVFPGVAGEAEGEVAFAGEGMLGRVVPVGTPDSYRVPMTTLPALVAAHPGPIEALKIDAEGYDLTILNTVRDWFRAGRVRTVLWERAGTPAEAELVAFLRAAGYRPGLDSYMLGFYRP
ncbi:MAG: FkbM family methyltransferase [Gemmataceae bacterium]|nr:FkbM family methyltransferase [Gemmataceae bacterium]